MPVVKEEKKYQIAAFCLFVRTSPIDFALLGGTRNRLKSKTKAKLKEKQIEWSRKWLFLLTRNS